jgi:hypothetical protein
LAARMVWREASLTGLRHLVSTCYMTHPLRK